MNREPTFFVPAATAEEQETVYSQMASACRCRVPPLDKRVYSITYVHNGEEWTATVGERLSGIRRRVTRSRGKKIEKQQPISDPAVVLAIFPGAPYMVFTNYNVGTAWENPFMAGIPKSIKYFASP